VRDPQIDIIDICTPNDSHVEIALEAAKHGKAILCEKPLAMECRPMRAHGGRGKKAKVPNMVCHKLPPHPRHRAGEKNDRARRPRRPHLPLRARYAQDWIADPKFPLVWRLQAKIAAPVPTATSTPHHRPRTLPRRRDQGSLRHDGDVREGTPARSRQPQKRQKDCGTAPSQWIGRLKMGHGEPRSHPLRHGRKNNITLEINGSKGSLFFDFET